MNNETYFQLEGEFLGVCAVDGYKLKYLQLRAVDSGQERLCQRDYLVKVPKELRLGMVYQLAVGDRIRCEGIQKGLKFKAYTIEKVGCVAAAQNQPAPLTQEIEDPANKSKVKILICQKSHCLNNGGKELYSALSEQLNSHSLNDSVSLQSTGCLKCCQQAPNLVVLPVGVPSAVRHRSSYSNVRISQVPAIVSKVRYHLSVEHN